MGLLDDAIREHLELKRLNGADPGDVARSEREALGREALEFVPPDGDHAEVDSTADPPADRDLSHVGPETVELDMRTVMHDDDADDDADDDDGHAAAHPASADVPAADE